MVNFFLKAEELKFRSLFQVRLGLAFRGFPPQFSQFFFSRVKVLTIVIRASHLGSGWQVFRTHHRLDGALTEPWRLNRLRDTNALQQWLLEPTWQMAAPLHHLLRHTLSVILGISFPWQTISTSSSQEAASYFHVWNENVFCGSHPFVPIPPYVPL